MSSRGNFDHHGLRWTLGGSGYQFYTTSPTVKWATHTGGLLEFNPGGSVVFVQEPKLRLTPEGVIDYEKTVIIAKPLGSTVEASGHWPYVGPTPSNDLELNSIMQPLFYIQNSWQVNGVPESVYYETELTTQSNDFVSSIKANYSLFNSWVQQGGQIHGANGYFPLLPRYITDFEYDTPPGKLSRRMVTKAPDTDWFGRGCTQIVNGIRFIILHDTEGNWYCWREDAPIDSSVYASNYSTYGDQSYKANIIPAHAQKVTPEYPDWVCPAISWRDRFKSSDALILEPRYSFSFNSTGTRATSVMIERRPSLCEFYETNYTPDMYPDIQSGPWTTPMLPTQLKVDKVKLDTSLRMGFDSDPRDLYEDRRGFVELELKINEKNEKYVFSVSVIDSKSPDELKKLNKGALVEVAYAAPLKWSNSGTMGYAMTEDAFTVTKDDLLSVWITIFQHAENKAVVDAYDGEPSLNVPSKTKATFYKRYKGDAFSQKLFVLPLSQAHGAGYVYQKKGKPIDETLNFDRESSKSLSNKPNSSIPQVWYPSTKLGMRWIGAAYIVNDDGTLTLTTKLPETVLDSLGNPTSELRMNPLVTVVGTLQCRYETELPEGQPHDFVWNTNQTVSSRYPVIPKPGMSEALYYYSAKIEQLDLSTLSFYYTVRLLEQTHGTISDWTQVEYTPIYNTAKTVCTVCVMGRDIDEVEVGNTGLPTTWIWGWRHYAGNASLDEQEEPYALDMIHSIRGLGVFEGANAASRFMSIHLNFMGHLSWVNCGGVQSSGSFFEQASSPWFLIGPCGLITLQALTLAYQLEFMSFPYEVAGVTVTIDPVPEKHLRAMEQEDMESFCSFIYNWYDSFLGTATWTGNHEEFRISDIFAENPFPLACNGLDEAMFIEKTKGYMWMFVQYLKETISQEEVVTLVDWTWKWYASGAQRPEHTHSFNFNGMYVLPRGGGYITGNEYNMLIEPDDLVRMFEKQLSIKNFELGTLYYNQAIQQHFHGSWMSTESKICVTPSGHVSYFKRDVYDISKEFCVQSVMHLWHEDYSSEYAIPIPTRVAVTKNRLPDFDITVDDIDWKGVDGLSWYFGAIKTTHLNMYNLAYQDYSTPESKIPYLHHNEVLHTKYSEADFKPIFTLRNNGQFYFIQPFFADQQPGDLQRFGVPWESGIGITDSNPPWYDYRPFKKMLRLSPLFF